VRLACGEPHRVRPLEVLHLLERPVTKGGLSHRSRAATAAWRWAEGGLGSLGTPCDVIAQVLKLLGRHLETLKFAVTELELQLHRRLQHSRESRS